jgi:glycosyltransferase involved in cell wall biosynthesis
MTGFLIGLGSVTAARPKDIAVSFIIPAHDEEALVGKTVDSIIASARAVSPGDHEIIVVDDASTDGTAAIAAGHGARVIAVNHRQIAATRNSGAKAARGNILIFVDADTQLRPAALRAALHALSHGFVGGGSCIEIERPLPLYGVVMERLIRMFAPAVGLAGGCFFFCTRDAFEKAGGFDPRLFAAEEVALAQSLARIGRFIVLRQTVLTSGRKLRAHSALQMLHIALRIARTGPKALQQREGLDIWYGPRKT